MGKSWRTSEAALKRFLAALPQSAPASAAPPIRTPSQRVREFGRAKAILKNKYGI
jgi:hypothetical protein